MGVLIVEGVADRAARWAGPLQAQGWNVHIATSATDAVALLDRVAFRVIVLNLELPGGEALSVPVYAGYRQPVAQVVVVTGSGMFNDGSIFQVCSNVCGFLGVSADPADLVALVDHHAKRPIPLRTPALAGNAPRRNPAVD